MALSSSCFVSRSRSAVARRAAWGCLVVAGVLIAAAAALAISRFPWWIEQRLRLSFTRKGYEQVELKVVHTAPRALDLSALRFAGPGWHATASGAHLRFRPFAFLANEYELLDLRGLDVEIDLDELLRRDALRLPTSLRELHRKNRYDVIRFDRARFQLRRGGLVQRLELSGDFRTEGALDLRLAGEGVSKLSLTLRGDVAGESGDARLQAELKSGSFADLLDAFAPGWLRKNPVYAFQAVELSASLHFAADRPFVTDAGGIVHWQGWTFDQGRIAPARVHARKRGSAVVLESDTLELRREDGLTATGSIEATFAPEGSAADTPFLQGRLHVNSWSSREGALDSFVVPFAGTPANLRLGPARLSGQALGGRSLRELWVRLENPAGAPLLAEGKALLELPFPAAIPPGLAGSLPQPFSLPATGRFHGSRGDRKLDFAIHAEEGEGAPLQIPLGRFLVQLTANLTGSLRPGPPPREIPLLLDMPRLDWRSGDRTLLRISSVTLAGRSRSGLFQGEGKGLWEGEPFPVKVSQAHGQARAGEAPPTPEVVTSLSLGPIPLRDAAWPGNLVKAWRGTRSSGDLLLSGTLVQAASGGAPAPLQPDLAIRFRNGQLIYPDQAATASGVQVDARLVSLAPLRFAPGIAVAVDRISAGKVELSRVRLVVTQLGPEHVRVDSFEAGLLGGTIRTAEPVTIGPETSEFTVMFDLSRIQGAEAIKLFPKFKGRVEASISGRVPVAVAGGKVRFLEGHLYLDGSQPAHLSYDASGFLTSSKGELKRKSKFSQSVERALGNFTIQSLHVRLFDPADPTHPAIVKITGTGKSDQLNLPVNLTVPVEDEEGILQSLFSRVLSAGMNVLRTENAPTQ